MTTKNDILKTQVLTFPQNYLLISKPIKNLEVPKYSFYQVVELFYFDS